MIALFVEYRCVVSFHRLWHRLILYYLRCSYSNSQSEHQFTIQIYEKYLTIPNILPLFFHFYLLYRPLEQILYLTTRPPTP